MKLKFIAKYGSETSDDINLPKSFYDEVSGHDGRSKCIEAVYNFLSY